MCIWAPRRKTRLRRINFLMQCYVSGIYKNGDMIVGLGDFNGHVGRWIDGLHGGYGFGKINVEARRLVKLR